MQLLSSEKYSSCICEDCNNKLIECADFQKILIENQTTLYQSKTIKEEPYESPENFVADPFDIEEVIVKVESVDDRCINEVPNFCDNSISAIEDDFYDQSPEPMALQEDTYEPTMLNLWKCNFCFVQLKDSNEHQSHLKNCKHNTEDEQVPQGYALCPVCGKVLSTTSIRGHVRNTSTENP